jgi:hypothetical protein
MRGQMAEGRGQKAGAEPEPLPSAVCHPERRR